MTDVAPRAGDPEVDLVSAWWANDVSGAALADSWLGHPVTRAQINRRVSGDPDVEAAEYWRRNFVPEPLDTALSLGCGHGGFERHALQSGVATRFDAYDVSEGAIAQARLHAEASGLGSRVTYAVADLNACELPEARYDAIFGVSCFHHVYELEALFKACHRALKPGGLLFLNEYIGPSRFQATPRAVDAINRLLRILPERYRRNVYLDGKATDVYANASITWFEQNDPSEAVRSAEIMSVLRYYFDVVDFRPYGGAVQHMLLAGTARNYDPRNDADVALLESFAALEESLEDVGALASDFAAVVARPKPR